MNHKPNVLTQDEINDLLKERDARDHIEFLECKVQTLRHSADILEEVIKDLKGKK